MITLLIILSMPFLMVIMAAIISIPLTIIQYFEEWSERRKHRKKLDEKINFYERIYENTEDDKAYWLARIWNLKYERACLK